MTTVTLSGGDKLDAKLSELAAKIARGGTLRVGFLEGATYPDGTSVAQVAAINNFGAPAAGIPARPFFSNFIRDNAGRWGEQLANLLELNDDDLETALGMMGTGMAGQLRQAIVDTQSPANSMVTNLLKQRFPMGKESGMEFSDVLQAWGDVAAGETAAAGKPLVWSGNMLNSVDYEVATL